MALTQAQLDALIAQFGGETGGPGAGRSQAGEIPDPDIPGRKIPSGIWQIETPKGNIKVKPLPDGTYELTSAPNAPTTSTAGIGGTAGPHVIRSAGAGTNAVIWNDQTQQAEELPNTALPDPREPVTSSASGTFWRFNPTTQRMEAVGYDEGVVAERQRIADEARRKAQQDEVNQIMEIAKYDQKAAEDRWAQYLKVNYEIPQARAAFGLQLRQEERAGIQEVQRAREAAGMAAVKDVVDTIPYMYSPGFVARRNAILDAGQRGGYAPAAAGTIQLPNLQAARAGAERAAQAQSANLLGIDLPPTDLFAGVPHYPGPPPPGAVLPTPEENAADWARRIAGAQQRLGPAGVPVTAQPATPYTPQPLGETPRWSAAGFDQPTDEELAALGYGRGARPGWFR